MAGHNYFKGLVILIVVALVVIIPRPVNGAYFVPATLIVHVQDIYGNSIPNATVSIEKSNLTYLTDKAGDVTIYLGSGGNFTVKVSKNEYQTVVKNITVAENSTVTLTITLIRNSTETNDGNTDPIDEAKDIYEEHKTAILVGGAIIFLLLILAVMGSSKKIRW